MWVDLRFAVRRLRRDKRFLFTAPLMLGLGIAANAIVYSLIYFMVFRPLPFPAANQLVRIYRQTPDSARLRHSPADFRDLRRQTQTLSHLAAYSYNTVSLARGTEIPSQVTVLFTTDDFFAVLGIAPEMGRTFVPDDDRYGGHGVVVISHDLWVQNFGSDENIVGKTVTMNSAPVEIIGVMPAAFNTPQLWEGKIDAWLPNQYSGSTLAQRDRYWMSVVGRIKPEFRLRDVQNELSVLFAGLSKDYPETKRDSTIQVVPLKDTRIGDTTRNLIYLLSGLAAALLILICSNLANLQLARLLASADELALRIAVGASVIQAMGPLFFESIIVSGLSAIFGYFVAAPTIEWLGEHVSFGVQPEAGMFTVGSDVFVVALVTALIASLIFGAVPAFFWIRHRSRGTLTINTRTATETPRQKSVRCLLITVEVAVSLALISAAVCCSIGVSHLQQRPLGWIPKNYATASLYLPPATYNDNAHQITFVHSILQRLREIPDVENASASVVSPVWGYYFSRQMAVEGQHESEKDSKVRVFDNGISENYFATAGMTLRAGRGILATDDEKSRPVVVINRALANAIWPGEEPLGKRLALVDSPRTPWLEVVGVVDDIHPANEAGRAETRFQIYHSLYQRPNLWLTIEVRTNRNELGLNDRISRAVVLVDPQQAIYGFSYGDQTLEIVRSEFAFCRRVLATLGILGMLILSFGVYSVLSNSVAQRTREIAIRLVLGATSPSIVRLLFDTVIGYIVAGAVIGLLLSAAIVRVLNGLSLVVSDSLHEITAVLSLVALLQLIFVTACALVPAYFATSFDPIDKLKGE